MGPYNIAPPACQFCLPLAPIEGAFYNASMPEPNRRSLLKLGGITTLLAAWSGKAEAGMFLLKKLMAQPPRDTPFITPNRDFYIVTYSESAYLLIKDLKQADWSLSINGLVGRPRTLTYADLAARPSREMMVTLECIENPVGGESISNAVWRGVTLRALLEETGADRNATDVVFKGADGYTDSIPLATAMEGDVLLAYQMNGEPLPREHGFPLRAVVPGIFGIKNVKWITEISVTAEEHFGYWQQRGWSDLGVIPITSRIDRPGNYQELTLDAQSIRGIAFAGRTGISQVEVSTDGGGSWREAVLAPTPSPYSWIHWSMDWTPPKPGRYEITVRAKDREGQEQIAVRRRTFPNGPTGLHTIKVDVVKKSK